MEDGTVFSYLGSNPLDCCSDRLRLSLRLGDHSYLLWTMIMILVTASWNASSTRPCSSQLDRHDRHRRLFTSFRCSYNHLHLGADIRHRVDG